MAREPGGFFFFSKLLGIKMLCYVKSGWGRRFFKINNGIALENTIFCHPKKKQKDTDKKIQKKLDTFISEQRSTGNNGSIVILVLLQKHAVKDILIVLHAVARLQEHGMALNFKEVVYQLSSLKQVLKFSFTRNLFFDQKRSLPVRR